jgi:hypothetical protein
VFAVLNLYCAEPRTLPRETKSTLNHFITSARGTLDPSGRKLAMCVIAERLHASFTPYDYFGSSNQDPSAAARALAKTFLGMSQHRKHTVPS